MTLIWNEIGQFTYKSAVTRIEEHISDLKDKTNLNQSSLKTFLDPERLVKGIFRSYFFSRQYVRPSANFAKIIFFGKL